MSASSHTRLIALIVAGAFFMQHLDSSIIGTSLPQMARSFGVPPLNLSLGISIYLLTTAALLPVSGWLADRHGARDVFLFAIVVFTLSSLACGAAGSLVSFVIARALQGVGAALMAPVGRMVVLRNTQKKDLIQAVALITWPALLAPVIGPALGGFITTYFSWRWNFLLNVPLGLLGLIMVARFIPNERSRVRVPMDWPGFALSSSALVMLLWGLESLAHTEHWGWPLVMMLISVALGTWCIRHLQRTPHPLLDLSSFKVFTYRISNLDASLWTRIAINATPFLLPLLFQLGFGLSAWQAGQLVLVYFLGNIGIKPITTPLLRRFGFRNLLVCNGLLVGLSILGCAFFTADTARPLMMLVLLLAGASRSMQYTCLNTLAFADVSEAQRGAAATLSSMVLQTSSVLAVTCGALLLDSAQWWHHAAVPGVPEFQLSFMLLGLMGLVAALCFARLAADAGHEVSGHQPRRAVP